LTVGVAIAGGRPVQHILPGQRRAGVTGPRHGGCRDDLFGDFQYVRLAA
jgi:hypothetical protein